MSRTGSAGMKVVQLTSPVEPAQFLRLLARAQARADRLGAHPLACLCDISKGIDRDRGVDETGGQIAVFGRLGSRPFTRPEMEKLFLNSLGQPFKVSDEADMADWRPPMLAVR